MEQRETQDPAQAPVPREHFHTTAGRASGAIAILIGIGALVLAVADPSRYSWPLAVGGVLFGVLAWLVMLRPRVWATPDHLVLRSVLHTDHVPLAAVEQAVVRQVLAVRAGRRRFVSPAIGRTRRDAVKSRLSKDEETATQSYPVFVEDRIHHLADEARTRLGVRAGSPQQEQLAGEVRRTWAWPEIAGLVVLVAALVVALLAV